MADPTGTGGLPGGAPEAAASEQRAEGVRQLTDAALGYLSLEEMLAELLTRVRSALDADTAAVLLLDRDREVLVARAANGIEEEVREGVQVPLGRGFAGRIALERRPIAIEDLDHADIYNPLLRQRGLCSLLGVPLHVEGRVIGVLHAGTLHRRSFSEDDVRLLQLAADRASLAIDNAQLAEQRSVTETMQRTLLPMALPQIPGLRFSAKYLPAGSSVRIGGDWYDAFQLPDGRVAFVIGDVSGRGVLAASVMAETRTALRAYALEGHDLGMVMSQLNELLCSMRRNRSATVSLFALDLESEELAMVSAGHPPALLLEPGDVQRFVAHASGPPLGAVPTYAYETEHLLFSAGSTLLLYTDGLIERREEPIDRGLERLARNATAAARETAMTFADRVYKRTVGSEPLEDDIALLAIEALEHAERMELNVEATPRVLASLRRALARWLIELDVPERDRFDIVLAVSEAAGNAIEHAYGPREASFTVDCERSEDEVCVRVSDTGTWRAERRDERGRGLMLMREFMDSVDVRRSELGTVVTLRKRVSP